MQLLLEFRLIRCWLDKFVFFKSLPLATLSDKDIEHKYDKEGVILPNIRVLLRDVISKIKTYFIILHDNKGTVFI